jgi:hypothetical protein
MGDHMSYIPPLADPIPIILENSNPSVSTHDEEMLQTTLEIKGELKKLNIHMGLINDMTIDNGDIDE